MIVVKERKGLLSFLLDGTLLVRKATPFHNVLCNAAKLHTKNQCLLFEM